MKSGRILLAGVLLCPIAFGAEVLQGYITPGRQPNAVSAVPPPYLLGQVHDLNNASTQYSVRLCIDVLNPPYWCPPGTASSATVSANQSASGGSGNNFYWQIPSSPVGSVNLRDGNQHYVCPWAISLNGDSQANDLLLDFARPGCYPVRWDSTNSNLMPDYAAVEGEVYPLTPAQTAVFVNSSDSNSTGAPGGNLLCTVNGASIYDNGFAGTLIKAHGIPCANVVVISIAVQDAATVAAFNTAMRTALNGLPSSIQAIALAWAQPSVVVGGGCTALISNLEGQGGTCPGYGIAGWTAMYGTTNGIEPGYSFCIQKPYGVGQGPFSPVFNSPTSNPQASGFRFTILAAAAKCTDAWNGLTGCDAFHTGSGGFAADVPSFQAVVSNTVTSPTNPSGLNVQIPWTTDPARGGAITSEYAPILTGTFLSPEVSYSLVGSHSNQTSINPTSGTTTNVLLYPNASNGYYFANMSMVAGGGLGYAVTSFSAQFNTSINGSGQSWIGMWLINSTGGIAGNAAVAAGGEAVEPCEIISRKMIYPDLFEKYYTDGNTIMQSFWYATRHPWGTNLWGDPFARLWSVREPSRRPTRRR